MFKWLTCVFKKNCIEECEALNRQRARNERQIKISKKLREQGKENEECLELMLKCIKMGKKILSLQQHNGALTILTVTEIYNHCGQISVIYIHVFSSHYSYNNALYNLPSIRSTIYYEPQYKTISSAEIDDFAGTVKNQGFGSIVMKEYIKYIKNLGVKKVAGKLLRADTGDEQHEKLLYHFYQKFGFQIDEKENILLELE